MTDPRPRGVWGDPSGARAVLDALGGPVGPRTTPDPSGSVQMAPRAAHRGRCGNGAHPEVSRGRGRDRVVLQEASEGCPNEVTDGRNVLRLCESCLAKYRAVVAPAEGRVLVAHLGAVKPAPGLCDHGLRAHQCQGICFRR